MTAQQEYFTEPVATELEKQRAEARAKRRLTFDCFNACCSNGYVQCSISDAFVRQAGRIGGQMSLYDCLRGHIGRVCMKCINFDTE